MESKAPQSDANQGSAGDAPPASATPDRELRCDVPAAFAVLPAEAELVHQYLAGFVADLFK